MCNKPKNNESFENVLSKIRMKWWEDIRNEWTRYIPIIPNPGNHPTMFLENHIDFQLLVSEYINSNDQEITKDIPSLRPWLLWEAIYYMHKANHVLAAAELHVERGMLTWSLSSAYHSAFFAVKSIINLWGVCLPKYSENNKSYLLDLFHDPTVVYDRTRRQKIKKYDHVFLCTNGIKHEVQHKHIWSIFHRILNVSQIKILPIEWIKILKSIEINGFAKQRNHIHYKHEWIFEDLFELVFDDKFGFREIDLYKGLDQEGKRNDFSHILAHLLTRTGYLMLKDISSSSVIIEKEIALMKSLLINNSIHPLHSKIKEYDL